MRAGTATLGWMPQHQKDTATLKQMPPRLGLYTTRQSWPAIAITKILSYQACTPAGSEPGQARTSQGTQPPAAVAPLTLPLFSTSDTTNGLELLAAATTENTGNYQPGPQLRSFCRGLAHSTCSITITQRGEAHTGPRICRDVGGDSR